MTRKTVEIANVVAVAGQLRSLSADKYRQSKEPEHPEHMKAYYTGQFDGLCTAAATLERFIKDAERNHLRAAGGAGEGR